MSDSSKAPDRLAMIQTNTVIENLQKEFPEVEFVIETMETVGDFVQDKPLANIGQSNLFTKELERALAASKVDMLVHSMKDLPSKLPEGMVIAAIYQRDDPFDAIVLQSKHRGRTLSTLPEGSVLGTSSVRRIATLKHAHPHLRFKDVRGNLNTRLRKLDEGKVYDGLILATAGMQRMGWDHRISQVLNEPSDMYAVSQGALGVEVLQSNSGLIEMLSSLNHEDTVIQCVCERALLRTLDGGCSAPVAVRTEVTKDKIELQASTLSLDGSERISSSKEAILTKTSEKASKETAAYSSVVAANISGVTMATAEELGISLAKELLSMGADKILREAKEEIEKRR
ncbi:putative porphobilinogen deaminase isoform X2 [Apostichopus japonicus]|uniref:hydroxymethylbilane synthase n=1 Tax=Stichopus japonicus TaxID=307972 RepID=A0A2G8LHD2_STIJA|nr:putative porphobilinogen deaminase isoform X2 [Apostichopus japonicus]